MKEDEAVPYFRKFEGEKLFLSPIDVNDAETYAAWLNDPVVAQQLNSLHRSYSVEEERKALQRLAGGHHFAIVETSQEQLLGNCGLDSIDWVHRTAELGIFIGSSDDWGHGYGSEALALLLRYGFTVLNLNNIMLRVNSDNVRAQRCYDKAGFRAIGLRRQALQRGRQRLDEIFMDILAEDFYAAAAKDEE